MSERRLSDLEKIREKGRQSKCEEKIIFNVLRLLINSYCPYYLYISLHFGQPAFSLVALFIWIALLHQIYFAFVLSKDGHTMCWPVDGIPKSAEKSRLIIVKIYNWIRSGHHEHYRSIAETSITI